MRLCPVGRILTFFSWILIADIGIIAGTAYNPLFSCFPQCPFCWWILTRGNQVCFASYAWRTLSTTGTIFQLYDTNLYCTATCGSTCFSYLFKLETERRNFSRENSIPIFGQRCIIPIFEQRTSRSFSFCGCFDLLEYDSDYRTWERLDTNAASLPGSQDLPAAATKQTNHPAGFFSGLATWYRKVCVCRNNFLHSSRGFTKPHQPVGWTFEDELLCTPV